MYFELELLVGAASSGARKGHRLQRNDVEGLVDKGRTNRPLFRKYRKKQRHSGTGVELEKRLLPESMEHAIHRDDTCARPWSERLEV